MPRTMEQRTTEPAPARRPWQRPTVRDQGRVRDLVRGFGKSIVNADADPQSTVKAGTG